MSVRVEVCDENYRPCRGHVIVRAAHKVSSAIPLTDAWMGIDHMDLEDAGDRPSFRAYHRMDDDYLVSVRRKADLERVLVAMGVDLSTILLSLDERMEELSESIKSPDPAAPEVWRCRAERFVLSEMQLCIRRISGIEASCTSYNLNRFLEELLKGSNVTWGVVPEAGLELRLSSGQTFILKHPKEWKQGARGLSYNEALQFLGALPESCHCRVSREGTEEQVFDENLRVPQVLEVLKGRKARKILHQKLPHFTLAGDRIP